MMPKNGLLKTGDQGIKWICACDASKVILWILGLCFSTFFYNCYAIQKTSVADLPENEFRGVWVTRWNYSSPQDIHQIMQTIANAHFNAVMFQVRGRADAFYQSDFEPWGSELTGVLGLDPGWDPLQTAIDEAHVLGLEIHAWVNAFACWSGTTPPNQTTPPHILVSHPEWLQADMSGKPMPLNSNYVYVSPGNPEVQNHIMKVVIDIASKYKIDGVHFDYMRYAGREYSHDAESEYRFIHANPSNLEWDDWQREQVNQFMARAYREINEINAMLKITAAVWGVYKDKWGWNTSEGFRDYYQDSQLWLQAGIADAICPMAYWPIDNNKPPYFDKLADDFKLNSAGRHVYMGINGEYKSFKEIKKQLSYCRSIGAQGAIIFAYTHLMNQKYWKDLLKGPYRLECKTPEMIWKHKKP